MTPEAEIILRRALALREQDRADLAAELLVSLDANLEDDPATVAAMWAEELNRRFARVLSEDVSTESWPDLRDRLTNNLSSNKP